MAASSMKDIKLRIKSVESTMQITKAMELVASSKLRRAKERAEETRPYFTTLHECLTDIAYGNTDFSSPFVQQREVKKTCYIMIAGDRGLETVTDAYATAEDVSLGDCFSIARMLCGQFRKGAFDALYVGYTNFVSMLSQQPAVLKMLPIRYERREAKNTAESLTIYEPSSEAVYDAIVPEYVGGLLWGAMAESVASEQGARRTAMDAASKNAGDMIEDLSLKYNRARQGAITQEITEIVAGAEA